MICRAYFFILGCVDISNKRQVIVDIYNRSNLTVMRATQGEWEASSLNSFCPQQLLNMKSLTLLSSRPRKQTKTSLFIKFLIRISFLPLTMDERTETLSFKLISVKTLFYVLLYIGPNVLIYCLLPTDTIQEFNANQTPLEAASGYLSLISGLCLLFPPGIINQ